LLSVALLHLGFKYVTFSAVTAAQPATLALFAEEGMALNEKKRYQVESPAALWQQILNKQVPTPCNTRTPFHSSGV